MKLACTQENLNQGLNIVGRMVGKNATLPVLGNILLKTETGGLRLTATDLELGVSCLVGSKIEEKGEVTIPARLLNDYVNQLPKNKVGLTSKGKELELVCEDTTATIRGIKADEFPLIPKIEPIFEAIIDANEIQQAINKVVFSVANDESRPEIAGASLIIENNTCTLAATDSFRLAEQKFSCKSDNQEKRQIIIPAKTLIELSRIIRPEGNVQLKLSDNQILFKYENIDLISRLIEGSYPEYKDIIPANLPTKTLVDREEFINEVKTAGLFSSIRANDIKVSIDTKNKVIKVAAEASQVGGHTGEVSAQITGNDDQVIFNYRYLLEGLNAFTAKKITIETGGSSSPGKIVSEQDKDYLYVVMPIKL